MPTPFSPSSTATDGNRKVSATFTHLPTRFGDNYGALVKGVNLPSPLLQGKFRTCRPTGQRAATALQYDTAEFFTVDLFAGAGGASMGIELATGRSPSVAINHCVHSIEMHSINHPAPATRHFRAEAEDVAPWWVCEGKEVDLLWASPDCTTFSQARGSKLPIQPGKRWLGYEVVRWIKEVRPKLIFVENVSGYEKWGPPEDPRSGKLFRKFIKDIKKEGYDVEYRKLQSHHYGAATARERLFIVARSDGRPIVWPAPTHGPGLKKFASAADCLDWNIPAKSIFVGKKVINPYAKKKDGPFTWLLHRRISAGVIRFVAQDPELEKSKGRPVIPYLITDGWGARKGQYPRVQSIYAPIGTIVAGGVKQGLVTVHLGPEPNPEARSFLRAGAKKADLSQQDAYPTVRVGRKDRYISDITYRKPSAAELQVCQGFPKDYVIIGDEKDRVARVGNSVVPQVAKALVKATLKP